MKSLFSIFYLLLGVIVLLLAVANRELVTLKLTPLPYQLQMPLILVVLLGVLIGILMVGPGAAWRRWRLQRQLAKAQARAAKLEATVASITAERDRYRSEADSVARQIDQAHSPQGPQRPPRLGPADEQ
ncbi:MAG: hypothetical protein Tsb0016_16030 [Sphingomonadales bacterium]